MKGKKGMSPLIATILLMAFAVALGAVIMNWSTTLPEGGPDCTQVKLDIRQFCFADNTLSLSLRNVGDKTLEEVSLSIDDPPISIPKLAVKGSKLGSGEILNTKIPFGFTQSSEVGIIPSLQDKGEIVACGEPVYLAKGLQNC